MKSEDILPMSIQDIDRMKVIDDVIKKRIKQRHAAQQLHLSTRQVRRLVKRLRREGPQGLIHGLRGHASNHQLESGLLKRALDLVKADYHDFGPTFANEKLAKIHKIFLSTYVLRQGMIRGGLWRPRRSCTRHRAWRERRPCLGDLVQLDGSDHDWFEGRGPRCALLIFIDDATSRILYGEFIPVEDTLNLLKAVKAYLLLHGRPVAFYVDRDSIYKVNRHSTVEEELREEQPLSQFSRAMEELAIEMIFALSPQAKGRVERGFKTHQDRLVKELRLAGIATIREANTFLWNTYISDHNTRCAVPPADPTNTHRPLLPAQKLEQILSLRVARVVANDFTLRFRNRFFQLRADQPVRVRPKDAVLVEIHLDGSTHIRFRDQYLHVKPIVKRQCHATDSAGTKLLRSLLPPRPPCRPPKTHPWKNASYARMMARKSKTSQRLTIRKQNDALQKADVSIQRN